MADHKAATEVTIVQEEKSAFGQLVDRLWKPAAAAAVIGAAAIVGVQYTQAKDLEAKAGQWDRLGQAMSVDPYADIIRAEPENLRSVLGELEGTSAEDWGQVALITAHVTAREYDEALTALAKVREQGLPEFTEQLFPFGEDGLEMTLADHLEKTIAAQREWEQGRASLFTNPEPAENATRVRLETSAGSIVVALYEDLAPKHTENFLKLCDEEYYAGTKFHRVIPGFMIQGGDPNTKEGAPDTWGQGGPDYKIDREENDLHHFRGVLSAAKQPGEIQSSGSQFFITTSDALHLDGQHVVFGKVLEGMDVADTIVGGEIDPTSSTRDRPLEPVTLTAASRL